MAPPEDGRKVGDVEQDVDQEPNGEVHQPPWQRVAKETAEVSSDADTAYFPTRSEDHEGDARTHDGEGLTSHTGDLPVVTGSAAGGMFGGAGMGQQQYGNSSAVKGQANVGAAGADTTTRTTPSALRRPGRGPRRASLQIKRIDPWSVLKLSLVLGVALFLVWLVAVGLLYIVLDGMGVWDKLNGTYTSLVSGEGEAVSDPLISAGNVFGVAAIIGMINIVLMSALATVCAFIYNVSADLAGGLEVTLSERE
ncbi:DUF3566 domain-containing protein [Haloechinothrix salitolerans]|uniref:DUF3566 domain-containing protein n=1 Tax=Haloechinothrix salitolerans TaxID=926830 RepID=A0ABW2BS91_9PSEU